MWSFIPCWLSHTCVPLQIGSHIKRRVQELGHGCAALVTKAGALQCSPSDAYTKKELIESARKVSEKVNGPERGVVVWSRGRDAGLSHVPLEPPHWVLPWLCWALLGLAAAVTLPSWQDGGWIPLSRHCNSSWCCDGWV